jgi:hypothetical protein
MIGCSKFKDQWLRVDFQRKPRWQLLMQAISRGYIQTGQITCHDANGREIPCRGTGHDGELRRGAAWLFPRFEPRGDTVLDRLTGLEWAGNANLPEFPLFWQDALDYVSSMNRKQAFGHRDWRLPNRRELRSLISYQTKKPPLPAGHPFRNVFPSWYWTSTTAAVNPSFAWYIHMEGARMFYGHKEESHLCWPVRGQSHGIFPATGQTRCYDAMGQTVSCENSGQDPEYRYGFPWPEPRFEVNEEYAVDRLTGLRWRKEAEMTGREVSWEEAFEAIKTLKEHAENGLHWRLPNVNELESLVDCGSHNPALPAGHPFEPVHEAYWSSTTSMFEPDWAWVLYANKGALGVGHKAGRYFHVWAVSD